MAKITVGPGKPVDYENLPADQQAAIANGVKSAIAKIAEKALQFEKHLKSGSGRAFASLASS